MPKLSIVVPCFNEEKTLEQCVSKVLQIADENLSLELIIVDDASSDNSREIGRKLSEKHPEIIFLNHYKNQGKGAALRTGFQVATGDYVAIQDADLEYDPHDLKRLIVPLVENEADVVLGSRFLSVGAHRVLYFWHSLGNKFLTFLSNMLTDLNLSDMETCYKVFRRDLIQSIKIEEERFGFEPEIVAKIADMRVRVYEMGISYRGRTYEEGKKIGWKDGVRALYCIFRYSAHRVPVPIQFLTYIFIGGVAAIANAVIFLVLFHSGVDLVVAAPTAFIFAAILNYLLCIAILFRHKARWSFETELTIYWVVVLLVCPVDYFLTKYLISAGLGAGSSKIVATAIGLLLNFAGRRFVVFPEAKRKGWNPQHKAN